MPSGVCRIIAFGEALRCAARTQDALVTSFARVDTPHQRRLAGNTEGQQTADATYHLPFSQCAYLLCA